ncbi:hypothetical protein N7490_001783 [Penicillium lividum]|nr:hypothetical protein N7490_001783 [Penicillium lividum]
MEKDGSVVIPGLFHWLSEDFDGQHPSGILPMVLQEIDMYDWHYRARPELLLGMHRDIREWFDRLRLRGYTKDSYVQRIEPMMWTEDDEHHFGYTWTKQKCSIGDVRLSLPSLPHGSTGPATSRRINILPWFVSVGADHQTLDTAESGTWDDLSRCHRDFHSGTKTPSGLANSTYGGRIDEIFPATVRLGRLGAFSDALIGQTRWDGVDVREELDILFGDDDMSAWEFVRNWRQHAQQLYVTAFKKLVTAERATFGANSFFQRAELGLDVTPAFIKEGVYWPGFQHETSELPYSNTSEASSTSDAGNIGGLSEEDDEVEDPNSVELFPGVTISEGDTFDSESLSTPSLLSE